MTFDRRKAETDTALLIDQVDPDFYLESEDEEIDLDKIKIHNRHPSAE
ncbi:MAG: hypothetical protein MUC73_10290 [Cyclobacteriaceae bacterium]|nr:hypothetical protein [Cyclobacteriaceae bacterium]